MKALTFHDRRDLRLEEHPTPEPGPGEVRLRVTDAGLSQTQINEFMEGPFIINHEPHPLTGIGRPLIPSQEYGGVVDRVGAGVNEGWLGRQVAVLPSLSCGNCDYCRAGREQLCAAMAYCGLLGAHGGFAEYSVVPVANVAPVAAREHITFIEPILVGIHAGQCAPVPLRGQRLLVLGAGAVGCSIAAVLRDYYGASVSIYDQLGARLERAETAGLETTGCTAADGPFDGVVDAAGQDSFAPSVAYTDAAAYATPGGYVLHVGTYFHPIQIVPSNLLVREISIVPVFTYNSHAVPYLHDVLSALDTDFGTLIESTDLDHVIEEGYYRAAFDKSSFTRLCVSLD